jgi:hypothetical protein
MKIEALLPVLLVFAACASNPDKVAMHDENDNLCENHKSDFQYFRAALEKERARTCSNGCAYTASMNKSSDTMERIAGLYYLMNCDSNHGRL